MRYADSVWIKANYYSGIFSDDYFVNIENQNGEDFRIHESCLIKVTGKSCFVKGQFVRYKEDNLEILLHDCDSGGLHVEVPKYNVLDFSLKGDLVSNN
jgi:hypothetical protein